MFEAILSATLLLAQSTGPGFIGRPASVNSATDPGFSGYVCLNDPRTTLNLRSGPGTSFRTVRQLRHGESIRVIRAFIPNQGWYWDEVVTRAGQRGFVRDDYVCVD
jgi:uncharacterized protein YgiM (DUF1202 family)